MNEWQPIETAPKDGTSVITGVDIATAWIVRFAWWDDGTTFYDGQGHPENQGWWSYRNSVAAEKLEGIYEPTHWIPCPPTPGDAD
jgi:hypothetical protein